MYLKQITIETNFLSLSPKAHYDYLRTQIKMIVITPILLNLNERHF